MAWNSIGFLIAIAFWKEELFTWLDNLSHYLQNEGVTAPFPLYSTLIVLSGYTFGTWPGAVVSYLSALSGAVIVFLLSRHYLRDTMSHLLTHTTSLKRAVRAIERKPQLLLLIRVAPYPYNLMNVLLASSHTLSFSTYFWCTALSLCKIVIHTSIGAGIHSFAAHHLKDHAQQQQQDDDGLSTVFTICGITLCIAIFIYLTYVARRAVNDELNEEDELGHLGRLEGGRGRVNARGNRIRGILSQPGSRPPPPPPSSEPSSLSRHHSRSRHSSLSRSYTHHRSTRSITQFLPQAQESRVRLLDEDEMSMRQVDFEVGS
ncbi:hypothetical protein Clacol_001584 [Clathrus columnatus]|uniref:Golgi apparatus membrane protein TVP38 n=1 Tax=Clathrus columnatus TaxID=1419009 RepID=A0AAV4ZYK0_9AGAM|nr:hypothetical protein Clacol_001584 [Clathrus columnatus]